MKPQEGKESTTRTDRALRALQNNPVVAVAVVCGSVALATVHFYGELPRGVRDWAEGHVFAAKTASTFPGTGWVFAGYLDKDDDARWISPEFPRLRIERPSQARDRPYPFRIGDLVRPFRDLPQVIADFRTQGTLHQLEPPWTVTEEIRKSEDYTGLTLSPNELYSVMDVSVSALPGHDAAVWLRVTRLPPDQSGSSRH